MKNAALQYAAKGKPVFPCVPGTKRPLTRHGFKEATTDKGTIDSLWSKSPNANLAVPTGSVSGLVVLDVDIRKGIDGKKSLEELVAAHEPLPTTVVVKTPQGGLHYHFIHPGGRVPCSTGKLGPGLDVRGDGGYVLLPPSKINEGAYTYDSADISPAPLPSWLHELMAAGAGQPRIANVDLNKSARPSGQPGIPPSVRKQIDSGCTAGTRNATAFGIATQLRDEGHDPQLITDLVFQFAARCSPPLPEKEALATVESALKRPARAPAQNPNIRRVEIVERTFFLTPTLDWLPMPEVLPEPAASLVRSGAEAIGADPAAVTLPLLAAAAGAIGTTRRIQLKSGWCEPGVLWTVLIMPSGARKSPCLELAVSALQGKQDQEFQQYKAAMSSYKAALKAAKQEGAALPVEPVATRYVVKDATLPALAGILDQNPRGVLLARDELSAWVGGFDRFQDGEEASDWLEMHRAGPITVDRKSGDPRTIHVAHAAVSITGTIQPGTFVRQVGVKYFENGLVARFLPAMPPKVRRQWTDKTVAPEVSAAMKEVFNRLLNLDLDDRGLGIDLMTTPEAAALYVEFYNAHAAEADTILNDRVLAAYSKLEGAAARLALVIHCLRSAASGNPDPVQAPVDAASMEAGIKLAKWFAHETRRVYGVMAETADQKDARAVMELAKAKGTPLAIRDLMREGPCFDTADRAVTVVNLLIESGYVHWVEEPGKKGKTRTRFALTSSELPQS